MRLTWPDGFWVGYSYDMAGNLMAVEEEGATSGPGSLAAYGYDGLSWRTSASLAGGLVSQGYGYDDAAGRIPTKAFSKGLYELRSFANTAML